MSSFSLPTINDNPDGGWGPSFTNLPSQFKFKDIPYAPYSKSDKLGRFADWNDISGDNRQTNLGLASGQGTRSGAAGGRGRRDGQPAFGSGTASAFAYFHAEDESSFSLVDNKASATRRGGPMSRGRTGGRGRDDRVHHRVLLVNVLGIDCRSCRLRPTRAEPVRCGLKAAGAWHSIR